MQAIPTYTMSVFDVPKQTYEQLDKLIRRFWWVICLATGSKHGKIGDTYVTQSVKGFGI